MSCNVSSTTHRNVCFTHRFTVGFFDRVSVVHESSAQLNLYVTIRMYTERERSSCRVEKREDRQRTRSIREKKRCITQENQVTSKTRAETCENIANTSQRFERPVELTSIISLMFIRFISLSCSFSFNFTLCSLFFLV